MKIIHLVLGKANPERMNGVNKVVHQLANTQKELGYDVTVWGIANDLNHTYPKRVFKTVLFQQFRDKTICPFLKTAIDLVPKNTIFHIHGAFILEFSKISKLLKKRGIQYIFTPHGSFAEGAMEKNKWVKKTYFYLLERQLIQDAKAIQLLGINEFENLDNLIKIEHKRLIPNGISLHDIPALSRNGQRDLVFGFMGRIDIQHKGLDLMLKGFKQFLVQGGEGRLELIGDGKDRPKLEALASTLGIQDQIVFHGALFGTVKFQTLNTFDVFLHTSRMEGFPMAVLEAAALSIPCITSEATNINAYIEKHNAGIPLRENNPETIAEVLMNCYRLKTSNYLLVLGKNARSMVEQAFDWKHIAQQLVQTYTV